jgi:hypothetical protein
VQQDELQHVVGEEPPPPAATPASAVSAEGIVTKGAGTAAAAKSPAEAVGTGKPVSPVMVRRAASMTAMRNMEMHLNLLAIS